MVIHTNIGAVTSYCSNEREAIESAVRELKPQLDFLKRKKNPPATEIKIVGVQVM